MFRASLSAAALVLTLTATSHAQVKLQWKVAEKATTTVTVTSKTQQMLTINDMELETKVEETIVVKLTSGTRAKDGTLRRTGKVESLKADLKLPGGIDLTFDSAKKVEPAGTAADFLLDVFAAIPKSVTTFVYGKDDRIASVEVDTKPFKDLSDDAKAAIKGRFDADTLKTSANEQRDRIPAKAIKKGETWSLTEKAQIGGGQTLTFKKTYKYEGTIEKDGVTLDKISVSATDVKYAQGETGSPLKVTDSKLKIVSSNGTLLFDRMKGEITSETDDLHVKGDMTFDANGKELSAKLDLKIGKTSTVK